MVIFRDPFVLKPILLASEFVRTRSFKLFTARVLPTVLSEFDSFKEAGAAVADWGLFIVN
jgi:hypothetical protein